MAIEQEDIDCKVIVIDTNTYAGNFERALCAYLTGHFAACQVGVEFADIAQTELKHFDWWENNIYTQEDGKGSEFYRPCTIYRTEGINNYGETVLEGENPHPYAYFSTAIFVEEFPPQEVLDEMIQRAKKFLANPTELANNLELRTNSCLPNQPIKLTGIRFVEPEFEKVLVEKTIVSNQKVTKIRF